jgi:hypothetical protein
LLMRASTRLYLGHFRPGGPLSKQEVNQRRDFNWAESKNAPAKSRGLSDWR